MIFSSAWFECQREPSLLSQYRGSSIAGHSRPDFLQWRRLHSFSRNVPLQGQSETPSSWRPRGLRIALSCHTPISHFVAYCVAQLTDEREVRIRQHHAELSFNLSAAFGVVRSLQSQHPRQTATCPSYMKSLKESAEYHVAYEQCTLFSIGKHSMSEERAMESGNGKIRVVVADDSRTALLSICGFLEFTGQFQIVGTPMMVCSHKSKPSPLVQNWC